MSAIDFNTLQFDSPEIPDLCRQKYRELIGHWPEPGEFCPDAAKWAMAWMSKPEAAPPSFDRNALHGDMRELGYTTNGQTSDLIDLFEHHLEARHG